MTDSQVEAQVENNAEGSSKINCTKAIIAYLIEKFPLCFIAEVKLNLKIVFPRSC